MNSKQLNFFLVSEDLEAIQARLEEDGVQIVKGEILDPATNLRRKLIGGEGSAYQAYLCQRVDKGLFYEIHNGGYHLDVYTSYVIQFSVGGFYPYSDKVLHRSRLYSVMRYYDLDGVMREKEKGFAEWVKQVFKLTRSFLRKCHELENDLFTEKAKAWVIDNRAGAESGGQQYVARQV